MGAGVWRLVPVPVLNRSVRTFNSPNANTCSISARTASRVFIARSTPADPPEFAVGVDSKASLALTARPALDDTSASRLVNASELDTLRGANYHLSTVPPEPGGGTRALSALPHSAPRHSASCGIPNSAPGFRGKGASEYGTDGCAPTGCGGVAMPSVLTPHYAPGHLVPVVSLAGQPRPSLRVSCLPHGAQRGLPAFFRRATSIFAVVASHPAQAPVDRLLSTNPARVPQSPSLDIGQLLHRATNSASEAATSSARKTSFVRG